MKPERYALVGAGIVLFSVMSVLRYRFTWWPLNPMGMIVPVGRVDQEADHPALVVTQVRKVRSQREFSVYVGACRPDRRTGVADRGRCFLAARGQE